jgi:hypothetical protein
MFYLIYNNSNYGEDEDYSKYLVFKELFYNEMANQKISDNNFYDNNNLSIFIKMLYDILDSTK